MEYKDYYKIQDVGREVASADIQRACRKPARQFHPHVNKAPEAALGAKILVKTVEGSVTLTIPAGTPNGKRFRLKGKGMPKKGTGAGNLILQPSS